tara:strand:+ start:118 stop:483 length:366 start_codon:yes stop_codon:yes gene_type:complete
MGMTKGICSLDGRTFALLSNSAAGEVSSDVIFKYQQTDDLINGVYRGDTIAYGHIVARFTSNTQLAMLYHCVTNSGQLKAGEADAEVSVSDDGRVRLELQWKWLTGAREHGVSDYIEIPTK